MRKRQKGFSLIELLIVVAIILIIAAIAIPNLIRARIAANQSSAAASLRTLASASAMYQTTYQDGYEPTIGVLGPGVPVGCTQAGLIDTTLLAAFTPPAAKSGYQFAFTPGTVPVGAIANGCGAAGFTDMFSMTASPASSSTGTEYFCVDATNVIYQSSAAIVPAGATGCPIGGADTPIGN